MRRFIAAFVIAFAPLHAQAQDQAETDKSYLTQLIEDNLSQGARRVDIRGFEGALSSEATIDLLTVADADGIWLTLENLVLSWNRAAILRGRIDVEKISAAHVIVARPPLSENAGPAAEASSFSLPDLPVGIRLGALDIAKLSLGDAFLGQEIIISLAGDAMLAGGEGNANISATRLDETAGSFVMDVGYSNETRILALDLMVSEANGGIAAGLLGLPGRPSIDLSVSGTAPIDNYAAELTLASDQEDRLAGRFALVRDDHGQVINLDVAGDVSPLFAPEYQNFFGDNVALAVAARTGGNGEIDLENLNLTSQSLQLAGSAQIGPKGWPDRIDIQGRLSDAGGDIVLLPLAGPKTYVDSATFSVAYDSKVSPDWTTDLTIKGFDRPTMYISDLTLAGGGQILSGAGDAVGQVAAELTYAATGLELDDAGAAQAIGTAITGDIKMSRIEDQPLDISRISVSGAGLEAVAAAVIDGPAQGLRTQANIVAKVESFDRFAALAGQDLSGSGDLAIAATLTPLEGLFDVVVTGATNNLAIGIPQADSILAGKGDLSALAVRDTDGTRLETLRIATPAAVVNARADLTSQGSTAGFDIRLFDLGLIDPQLSGPATIEGTAVQDADGKTTLAATGQAKDVDYVLDAQINQTDSGRTINFTTVADVADLASYQALAGRPIKGAARVDLSGVLLGDGTRFLATVGAQTMDLGIGISQIDPLLAGAGSLSAEIARTGDSKFRLSDMALKTQAAEVTGDAAGDLSGAAKGNLRVRIADAAVLGPELSGPMTAVLQAERDATLAGKLTTTISAPAADINLRADIGPDMIADGQIDATIANLRPYRRLIGQPVSGAISAQISGTVSADLSQAQAKMAVQTDDLAIGNPTADILLAGRGNLDADASWVDGFLSVKGLQLSTANIEVSGDLDGAASIGRGAFAARLRDVGVLTDQLSGPIVATGTARLDNANNWAITAQAEGPGGIAAQASGQIASSGNLNMTATGKAPLGLANAVLEPRRISGDAIFDLAINGPAQLEAISGRVDLDGAELTAPTLAQGLKNITGGVTLANGAAQIGLTGDVASGGTVSVRGPVTLGGAQTADLAIQLADVVIKDPELYQTTIAGGLTVKGPLAGGAQIAGQLALGQTDIQVPSSGVGSLGNLPDVTHIGAPAAVVTTLDRSGLTAQGKDTAAATSSARPFGLDITIDAPSRIFIRGRGLDAELGGSLRIGGTTANIQPAGLFELVRGRIDILQQRFELTEGSASLQGDFEPFIRLVAQTEARTGTLISIIVEGPATEPEVSFVSTPALPQDEVLSQLIFGRDLQNISPLQAVQLASAVGTLAGRGGGGLIDTFRKNIGLDNFDVTTDEQGNAAVRAGKYLSENVYTDVTVSSDGATEINLNLDVTDEITAKGTVGADGETSIGIFFERDY